MFGNPVCVDSIRKQMKKQAAHVKNSALAQKY